MTDKRIRILKAVQIVLFVAAFVVGIVALVFIEPLVTAACIFVEFITIYNFAALERIASGLNPEGNHETSIEGRKA